MNAPAPAINAAALLMDRGAPSRTAIVHAEQSMSWSELRIAVARAGAAWRDCGALPGEVVQLHLPLDIEHAVAFLGAIWAGAVPVPLAREGVFATGQPWDQQAPCRFILAASRQGYATRWRDSVMTLAEWHAYLGESGPMSPARQRPQACACWTEPRTRDGAGARALPHAFATGCPPRRSSSDVAHTATILGMLKVLRRGGTAVLRGARRASAAPCNVLEAA
ncbi:hypothetical protein GCM10027034_29050 [Ramlibacter solisilvae]|uniref:AMP-dependent synthetase/ligase domain-containing protein n=1 Tax=Ramlibacter tataouinensis TaxID=94132 RepID=A0A127JRB0_9BURK|nr:AMP-binding protein [Ramlibacter tataouinensis]AMO22511.1 hypothetical protein UC35_05930 [Ramlibacter tataouinensis]